MKHGTRTFFSTTLVLLLGGVLVPGVLGAAGTVGPANWDEFAIGPSRNAVYRPQASGFAWEDTGVGTALEGLVVVGNTGYFATLEGNVEALAARTGAKRWAVHLPNAVFGPPIVHGGVVYVGIGNDTMALESARRWIRGVGPSGWYALDARTGRVLWYHRTVGNAHKGIVYSQGVLFTAGGGGHLRAMDPTTGRTIWKVFDGGVTSAAQPLVVDGLVVNPAGGPSFTSLWAFNRRTGTLVWRLRGANADNAPTYGHGLIYITNALPFTVDGHHMARNVYIAVDATTGHVVWRYAAPLGPFPPAYAAPVSTLHDGILYCVSSMVPYVMALNARTGRLLWRARLLAPSHSAPTVYHGYAFVADYAGHLYTLNASTGQILAQRKIGGHVGPQPVALVHGTVYLTSYTGNVLALADPGAAPVTAANTGNVIAIPVAQVLPHKGRS